MPSTEENATFKPHSHVPYGADGSGYYSDNTIGCYSVVQAGTPMILKALNKVVPREDRPFSVCDYGTADGGTSMFLVHDLVAYIRKKYGEDLQIHIMYEDQPINDFKSVFLRIHELIPGPPSYLKEFKNVYACAIGTGFYDQCVPDNLVDLGFSFTAMHWLTQRPGRLTGAIHHTTGVTVPSELVPFRQQAAKDWETLMLHRAKELRPGGQMVVVCFCVDKDNQFLGKSKYIKHSMYERMTALWRGMAAEGIITQEEFDNTSFNNYYRTVEEYSAPFLDPQSAVSKAGLKLVSIETKVVRCPYNEKWRKEGKKGDLEAARKHAKWYVPTTRTWSNSTFISGLDASRTEEEKTAIVDQFFGRYEEEVASAPEDHGMDYCHAYIHFEQTR